MTTDYFSLGANLGAQRSAQLEDAQRFNQQISNQIQKFQVERQDALKEKELKHEEFNKRLGYDYSSLDETRRHNRASENMEALKYNAQYGMLGTSGNMKQAKDIGLSDSDMSIISDPNREAKRRANEELSQYNVTDKEGNISNPLANPEDQKTLSNIIKEINKTKEAYEETKNSINPIAKFTGDGLMPFGSGNLVNPETYRKTKDITGGKVLTYSDLLNPANKDSLFSKNSSYREAVLRGAGVSPDASEEEKEQVLDKYLNPLYKSYGAGYEKAVNNTDSRNGALITANTENNIKQSMLEMEQGNFATQVYNRHSRDVNNRLQELNANPIQANFINNLRQSPTFQTMSPQQQNNVASTLSYGQPQLTDNKIQKFISGGTANEKEANNSTNQFIKRNDMPVEEEAKITGKNPIEITKERNKQQLATIYENSSETLKSLEEHYQPLIQGEIAKGEPEALLKYGKNIGAFAMETIRSAFLDPTESALKFVGLDKATNNGLFEKTDFEKEFDANHPNWSKVADFAGSLPATIALSNPIISGLKEAGIAGKFVEGAVFGASGALVKSGQDIQDLKEGQNYYSELAKNVSQDAVIGGVLNGAFVLVAKPLKSLGKTIMNKLDMSKEATELVSKEISVKNLKDLENLKGEISGKNLGDLKDKTYISDISKQKALSDVAGELNEKVIEKGKNSYSNYIKENKAKLSEAIPENIKTEKLQKYYQDFYDMSASESHPYSQNELKKIGKEIEDVKDYNGLIDLSKNLTDAKSKLPPSNIYDTLQTDISKLLKKHTGNDFEKVRGEYKNYKEISEAIGIDKQINEGKSKINESFFENLDKSFANKNHIELHKTLLNKNPELAEPVKQLVEQKMKEDLSSVFKNNIFADKNTLNDALKEMQKIENKYSPYFAFKNKTFKDLKTIVPDIRNIVLSTGKSLNDVMRLTEAKSPSEVLTLSKDAMKINKYSSKEFNRLSNGLQNVSNNFLKENQIFTKGKQVYDKKFMVDFLKNNPEATARVLESLKKEFGDSLTPSIMNFIAKLPIPKIEKVVSTLDKPGRTSERNLNELAMIITRPNKIATVVNGLSIKIGQINQNGEIFNQIKNYSSRVSSDAVISASKDTKNRKK